MTKESRKIVAKKTDTTTSELRQSTRFQGVQARPSKTKKHNGKPDICFTIDYYIIDKEARAKGIHKKKRIRKDIGWASDGFTAAYAAQVRAEILINERRDTDKGFSEIMPHESLTLNDAFTKYITEWLMPRGKSHTSDLSMFKKHLNTWAHKKLPDIDTYMLDTIIAELTQKGLSAQSVRYMIALIRRIMRRMEAWGLYYGQMPFNRVILPKPNNKRERFLTPNEASELLNQLKKRSLMMYTQALINLHCGLRWGEIANLTIADIDFYSHSILIRDSKSGKARQAVMTKILEEWLEDYISYLPTNLIFPSTHGTHQKTVSSTFERTVNEMGLNISNGVIITDRRQRVVFHTLRHTYASWLAMSGQGQAMIADLLGHSSLEMSARYTHLFPDARRATANAIEDIFKPSHE